MSKNFRLIACVPLCFTLLVAWFAWSAFHAAPQLAMENLRGAGLSIAAAIEQLAVTDRSLCPLARYTTPDIAYFALVSRQGRIEFHTNQSLIGRPFPGGSLRSDPDGISEAREKLGTGEVVYLLRTKVHFDAGEHLLVLALHTYRADQVIRRATTGVTVVAILTVALWILTLLLWLMIRRNERHHREMSRRKELARLGEMSAVLAHEIRTPLAGIKGFAQLVQDTNEVTRAQRYAGKVVTQSLRLEALVNDLLAFAREEQGVRKIVDLSRVVQDCANLVKVEEAAREVNVEVKVPPSCTALVVKDRIVQLLLNLMKNALQAMPNGGILAAGLRRCETSLQITVRDTGVGIPAEQMGKIFEPFWTSKAQGTGLGLALCRKIAEEHGGSLAVSSKVGSGTEFIVTLPLQD